MFVATKTIYLNLLISIFVPIFLLSACAKKVIVSDKTMLLNVIKNAKSGTKIVIADNTIIDITDEFPLKIEKKLDIIANNQNVIIKTNNLDCHPLILIAHDEVSLKNIIFCGPDSTRRTAQMLELGKIGRFYQIPNSCAIKVMANNVKVENCEIYGWSHAGIYAQNCNNLTVTKCNIHHNQRQGLGYGVVLDSATATISYNRFDWNRHSIAATGKPNESYEAAYNWVGPNANGHCFDVHAYTLGKKTYCGNKFYFHHNTFMTRNPSSAIFLGSNPTNGAEISHNAFPNVKDSTAILDIRAKQEKINISKNKFGKN